MRIHSAATSYIDVPSSKDDPFRGGPSQKTKNKTRSFARFLSSPIRKMGKQIGKRSKKRKDEKAKSKSQVEHRGEGQGWIERATTFETEDTLSPRSVGTVTTGDSSTLTSQYHDEESCGRLLQILPEQYLGLEDNADQYFLDLESGLRDEVTVPKAPSSCLQVEELDIRESSDKKTKMSEILERQTPSREPEMFNDDIMSPLSSDLNSELAEWQDEDIDSLAPAVDFELFHEEEESEGFHCVGRLSIPEAKPPIEIDVQNKSSDQSIHSEAESDFKLGQIDAHDDISTTSSYNSYLQAIQNITSSANGHVDTVTKMAIEDVEIGIPKDTEYNLNVQISDIESESEDEFDCDDEDSFVVSFTPSNALILQAMEGASTRAKIDIDRATAVALSKINSASSIQEIVSGRAKARTRHSANRIIGFVFFLLICFAASSNSMLQSIVSPIGIDNFQPKMNTNTAVAVVGNDLTVWNDHKFSVANPKKNTNLSNNIENAQNVACVFKLGCLAFGCI